jgi:hypothetical protein
MFRVRLVLIGMVSVAFLGALLFQRLEAVGGSTHPATTMRNVLLCLWNCLHRRGAPTALLPMRYWKGWTDPSQ